jgi:hypothetical protein
MDRKGIWIIAAAIVLGSVIFGISHATAQRDFRTEGRTMESRFHRYQVVNVSEGEIIIMDVTTGDIYSAKPKDVKPYSARPRPAARFPADGDLEKKVDGPFFKDKAKEERFFKDKEK